MCQEQFCPPCRAAFHAFHHPPRPWNARNAAACGVHLLTSPYAARIRQWPNVPDLKAQACSMLFAIVRQSPASCSNWRTAQICINTQLACTNLLPILTGAAAGDDSFAGEMAVLKHVSAALAEASKEVEEAKEAAAALGMGPGSPGSNIASKPRRWARATSPSPRRRRPRWWSSPRRSA